MKTNKKRNLFLSGLLLILFVTACSNLSDAISISSSKCTGCGKCVSVCPHGALSLSGSKAVVNTSKCVGCGKCIAVCPNSAISK